MAARKDYGQKKGGRGASRTAPKRPSGNARKPAPAKRRLPWLKLLVAVAMVGGLGYLLYSLTQVNPSQRISQPAPAKPSVQPAAKPAAKASVAKPAPQPEAEQGERFEFYKMLPKSEVQTDQVDAYSSTPRDAKTEYKYLLQAGSFRDPADAERMRAQLILLGLPNAHTSKSTGQNGVWYRVRVGPFDNRSLMNRAHDKLVRQNIQPMEIKLK
ncbi:SPOR domain-containing protein [Marinobacterium arenosum]|uniref:SPOR domain-containing protein n=1 Tax=Marinobacterium arenosum TaxID=2862496 RepID=UPI001C9828F5|nr:SPOR domain-containing protein [Marinobacterium arenosum]MBY4678077.1 SPOR domain-containing protein [Marinobacterium arenosum]